MNQEFSKMIVRMIDLKREYELVRQDIERALRICFEHQRWILGEEVGQLEQTVANYLSIGHGVGTSSGTEALVLALRALAIARNGREFFEKDDEIITASFTFTATGDAILRSGATPVFVDIDPCTYTIDPQQIEDYLASSTKKRVVGIVPVHLYGQPCDMEAIMKIARAHDLFVVEDAAQAMGARWNGRRVGAWGTMGALSFFPTKNLGGYGDGGMVVTDDSVLAKMVRALLQHGGEDKYNAEHIGYNARLDTLQAAILLAKFSYLEERNEQRRKIAQLYSDQLNLIAGLTLPFSPPPAQHVYNQYTVRLDPGLRDKFQEYLKERDIETTIYYKKPLHAMKLFDHSITYGDLKQTEAAASSIVNIPLNPFLTENEIAYVIETIRQFFKG